MSLFAKKGLRTKQFTSYAFVALGILPAFTVAFILHIYPIFQGIYTSLFQWSGLSQRKTFIGLSNYIRLFSDDIVWQAPAARTDVARCRETRKIHYCMGRCIRVCPVGK